MQESRIDIFTARWVSIKKFLDRPAMEERVDTEMTNKLLPYFGGEIF